MIRSRKPRVIVLAGPNGAGKSTAGPTLIRKTLGVTRFVDADMIARGLDPKAPARAAIRAGRVMLRRLRELAAKRVSFAFETTLASRTFAPWIESLINDGWRFQLVFLWLPSPELAVARVRDRVRAGGHHVPEEVVRRRYEAGLRNFFGLYQPLASRWRVYDNTVDPAPIIAAGTGRRTTEVRFPEIWKRIVKVYGRVKAP